MRRGRRGGCHGELVSDATPVSHTHTLMYSHGELAEFGLDAAVPHAHPGEGGANVSGSSCGPMETTVCELTLYANDSTTSSTAF